MTVDPGSSDQAQSPGWLAALFHENTKITSANLQYHWSHIEDFAAMPKAVRPTVRALADSIPVSLPKAPRAFGSLDRAIASRRTCRSFSGKPCFLTQLARVLRNACGTRCLGPDRSRLPASGSGESHFARGAPEIQRTVPSAGGLYPLEMYCAAFRVRGLDPGLYHYDSLSHALLPLSDPMDQGEFAEATLHEGLIHRCCCVLIIAAAPSQVLGKYEDRGYRYILLEAGHVAQNVLLTAADEKLASVPLGGFLDDELMGMLCTDGIWSPVYLIALGQPER